MQRMNVKYSHSEVCLVKSDHTPLLSELSSCLCAHNLYKEILSLSFIFLSLDFGIRSALLYISISVVALVVVVCGLNGHIKVSSLFGE